VSLLPFTAQLLFLVFWRNQINQDKKTSKMVMNKHKDLTQEKNKKDTKTRNNEQR